MLRTATMTAMILALAACSDGNGNGGAGTDDAGSDAASGAAQSADASAISLPEGFTATVFADDLGRVRHMAVRDDGTVYATLYRMNEGGGLLALPDADGDGVSDEAVYFGDKPGTGIALRDGWLYADHGNTEIVRYALPDDALLPQGEPEVIVTGFPEQRSHATKPMAFDGQGNMYVTVGAPSNACQQSARTPGSPGEDPCSQLELAAGVWRYDADATGQTHSPEARYATGLRNALAMAWNEAAGALYVLPHGRDQLSGLFPEFYDDEQSAELPAEEFHKTSEGSNHGWPYTYWDHIEGARKLAPEYGGDGDKTAEPGKYADPLVAFPGHWAPNDLLFYTADAFPAQYRNGAFVAFHGSWNRAPLPQEGYRVSFIPMNAAGEVTGEPVTFADGFKGAEVLESPGDAKHRPTGLAVGPDGALYIADDAGGRIWKVTYTGGS